jgi:hypothetical protein
LAALAPPESTGLADATGAAAASDRTSAAVVVMWWVVVMATASFVFPIALCDLTGDTISTAGRETVNGW